MDNIYVFPDAGGWAVRRGKNSLPVLATHCNQEDAIAFAQSVAAEFGVRVVVIEERRKTPRKKTLAD